MRKIYLVGVLFAGTLGLAVSEFYEKQSQFDFHAALKKYPNPNSTSFNIAGNTGAPGESTCATCHSTSLKIGGSESVLSIKDSLTVDAGSYKPNHTYTLKFDYTINTKKKGFQIIGLDSKNQQAGTLQAGTGTMLLSTGGKQYLNHSNATGSTWTFKWKAPATDVGDVTFYVAAGNLSAIYKSTYKLAAFVDTTNQGGGNTGGTDTTKTTGLRVNENDFDFTAFYVGSSQSLFLKCNTLKKGDVFVNVMDMNGRSVASKKLNSINGLSTKEIELPMAVQPGTYVVNMFINNYMSSKKIVVF
jgi:hypothetical protein